MKLNIFPFVFVFCLFAFGSISYAQPGTNPPAPSAAKSTINYSSLPSAPAPKAAAPQQSVAQKREAGKAAVKGQLREAMNNSGAPVKSPVMGKLPPAPQGSNTSNINQAKVNNANNSSAGKTNKSYMGKLPPAPAAQGRNANQAPATFTLGTQRQPASTSNGAKARADRQNAITGQRDNINQAKVNNANNPPKGNDPKRYMGKLPPAPGAQGKNANQAPATFTPGTQRQPASASNGAKARADRQNAITGHRDNINQAKVNNANNPPKGNDPKRYMGKLPPAPAAKAAPGSAAAPAKPPRSSKTPVAGSKPAYKPIAAPKQNPNGTPRSPQAKPAKPQQAKPKPKVQNQRTNAARRGRRN